MDTKLFVRQQAGGMFAVVDREKFPGSIFWVHSGTGTNSVGYGQNPDAPLASLAYAFSSDVSTANKGDVIVCMPGHAETVDGAADIVMDIAGVAVIGAGQGADRPTFTFSTGVGADINITANGILLKNLLFVAGLDGLTNPLHISAADVTIEDCEWRDTTDVEA